VHDLLRLGEVGLHVFGPQVQRSLLHRATVRSTSPVPVFQCSLR
jgi:hypothetical protein